MLDFLAKLNSGRIGRRNFLLGSFIIGIGGLFLFLLISGLLQFTTNTIILLVGAMLMIFLALVESYLYYALIIRRLHDLNKSWISALFLFAPVISFILAIQLFFFEGTKGSNRFGKSNLKKTLLQDVFNL